MFVVIGVAMFLANVGQSSMFGMAGERLTMRLRRNCFQAIIRNDIGWFDDPKHSTGILTSRLASDTELIQGLLGTRLGLNVQNFTTIIAGLVIAFLYQWKLTLVVLALSPLIMFANFMQMYSAKGFQVKREKATTHANQVAGDSIGAIRTVAAFTNEEQILQKYKMRLQGPTRLGVKASQTTGALMGVGQLFMFGSYCVAFWFGGRLIRDKEADFLDVMTVFMAIVMSAMSVGQSASFVPNATKAKVAASNVFKIIDTVPPIDSSSEAGERLGQVRGDVEFRDVAFTYPQRLDAPVFTGLNLKIKHGSVVALVGQSGSGKSTCIQLLERFYDPASGTVSLDGTDIKKLNVKWMRQQIGLVGQEPVLFVGTIAENISYGKPGATQSEIEAAAMKANAHNFIMEFPDKYNTQVGERGAQMSGGQKQRIAIARAIIKDPKILLLDEATSALDTESEKVVQEALDTAMKGRTTIIVAHRLSTIMGADQIAVVNKGKIVELGTHQQLVDLNGIYFNLVQRQTKQ
jgi:ATP-binding cassette subfamily B (MDR/TAP) protein 1